MGWVAVEIRASRFEFGRAYQGPRAADQKRCMVGPGEAAHARALGGWLAGLRRVTDN